MAAFPLPTDPNDPRQELVDALKSLTDSSLKLRESMDALAKQGKGGLAGAKANADRFGGGGVAAKAGPAGMAAAGYMALTGALGQAAKGMEIWGNSSKTNAQKFDALASEFIPGARSIIAFRDAVNGTADALRQQERQFSRDTLAAEHRAQRESVGNSVYAESKSAFNDAFALAGRRSGQGTTPVSSADRTTLAGERIYREEESRRPLQDAKIRADALAEAGHDTEAGSLARLKGLEDNRERLQGTLDAAKKRSKEEIAKENAGGAVAAAFGAGFGPGGSVIAGAFAPRNQAGKNAASNEVLKAAQGLKANELEIEKEIARTRETGAAAAQRDSAARKAGIALAQNELAILQAQGQAMRNNNQRLGGMTKMERMQGLHAARLIKEHGIGNVAPQIRDAASRFAPDFMRKEEEKFGENTGEKRAGKAEGFFDAEGKMTAKENRAAENKIKAEVAVNIALDEDALASKIAETISATFKKLIESIEVKNKAEMDAMKEGQIKKNAAS
jgi:hypothetical protein